LRSPGERPHAVIKRVFSTGRVLVEHAQYTEFYNKNTTEKYN
jgi:hypothetical protein